MDLILKNSRGKPPHYISPSQNFTDLATKPYRADVTKRWDLWLMVPEFLRHLKNFWPQNCIETSHEDMNVIAANSPKIVTAKSCSDKQNFMQHALNRTSNMNKTIRVVSTVLNCFNSCKQKSLKVTTNDYNSADKFHVAKIVL